MFLILGLLILCVTSSSYFLTPFGGLQGWQRLCQRRDATEFLPGLMKPVKL